MKRKKIFCRFLVRPARTALTSVRFQSESVGQFNENLDTKKRRLLWQSRKRGISENDLLLSTWFQQEMNNLTMKELEEYDLIINAPVNEWDLFYWISKTRDVPEEYQLPIMTKLQEHCENKNREERLRQVDI